VAVIVLIVLFDQIMLLPAIFMGRKGSRVHQKRFLANLEQGRFYSICYARKIG
jgi:hypothetical protein